MSQVDNILSHFIDVLFIQIVFDSESWFLPHMNITMTSYLPHSEYYKDLIPTSQWV